MSRKLKDLEFQNRQFRGANSETPIQNFVDIEPIDKPKPRASKKISFATGKQPAGSETGRIQLGKIPSYSKFVADYSRVHGMNYRDAMKDKKIKDLYRKNLNGDNLTMVKHSFEKKKVPITINEISSVGKLNFIDTRLNQDTFVPTDIQDKKEDNRFQLSRGLQTDMKRAYLSVIRSTAESNAYFNANYSLSTFAPISENLSKKILEIAIKTKKGNILETSPFMELGLVYSSFSNYQKAMTAQDRSLFELLIYPEQEEFIKRLNLNSIDDENDDLSSFDFIFLNCGSLMRCNELVRMLISKKLEDKASFDVVIVINKRLRNLAEFLKWLGFSEFRQLIGFGDEDEDKKLFDLVTDPVKYSLVKDETFGSNAAKLSTFMDNYSGDMRSLIEELKNQNLSSTTQLTSLINEMKKQNDSLNQSNLPQQFTMVPVEDPNSSELQTLEDITRQLGQIPDTPVTKTPLRRRKLETVPDTFDSAPPFSPINKLDTDTDDDDNISHLYYIPKPAVVTDVKKGDLIILSSEVKENSKFYLFDSYDERTNTMKYIARNGRVKKSGRNVFPTRQIFKVELPLKANDMQKVYSKTFETLKTEIPHGNYNTLFEKNRIFNRMLDKKERRTTKAPVDPAKIDFIFDEDPEQSQAPDNTELDIPRTIFEETDKEREDQPESGNGFLGNGISQDYDKFKKIFDPEFSLIGRNGIDYVYRLSF